VKRKAHLFHTAIYLCPRSFSPSFGKHTHNAHVFQSAKTPHCGTMCSVEKYINTSSSEHFSLLSLLFIQENPLSPVHDQNPIRRRRMSCSLLPRKSTSASIHVFLPLFLFSKTRSSEHMSDKTTQGPVICVFVRCSSAKKYLNRYAEDNSRCLRGSTC
jgi:hypothetical protein